MTGSEILSTDMTAHRLSLDMGRAVMEYEKQMFGENSKLISTLWKSAIFMRFAGIPPKVKHVELYRPIIQALATEDYDQARYYIEELMARYPQVLPEFVAEVLEIEPGLLRKMMEEEKVAPVRVTKEQLKEMRKKEKEALLATISHLLDRVLVSADGKVRLRPFYSAGRIVVPGSGLKEALGISGNQMSIANFCALVELLSLKPEGDQVS